MEDNRRRKHRDICTNEAEEVSSTEWEFVDLTDQEEDLVYRMHRLVGDRWGLIAGRLADRKPEEIERFWIMRHSDEFAGRRKRRARGRLGGNSPW
ncbi:unnamed protein product [Spirodela intermedia]|uniref:Myb-like domain-containing protein n=2 Tax=Spirodela intermedia TaxID=51605 RepID=A0A7I8KZY6_SPIIN|nr:unnamed protein product [Spirodela intermedia]CAA6665874.1 unnamed protein product [Spirodela intermedia]CAA7402638.1 unnamed protein product [Spirodela intermedia]